MTTSEAKRKKKKSKAVEVTSLLVTGIWLVALFTGQGWWLPALLVGYIVVVPLVNLLVDEEDEQDEEATGAGGEKASVSKSDAMETLRDRYAHGELTEEQFERKLEALIGTESLEDAEEWVLADSQEVDESEERVTSATCDVKRHH